jgi:hypothetical protein
MGILIITGGSGCIGYSFCSDDWPLFVTGFAITMVGWILHNVGELYGNS